MSLRRLLLTSRLDLSHNLRRPLYWIWMLIIVLMAWGLSTGGVQIGTGDSTVGGDKAHLTSEFAVTQLMCILILLEFAFFVAVAAGMGLIRDAELKIGELLHATPLRAGEYAWGKFLACMLSFTAMLGVYLLANVFFLHFVADAESAEMIGAFDWNHYLRPALLFGLPTLLFLAGTSFAIGEWSRRPILVFLLPVALFMGCGFFLWGYSPQDLSPTINQILMLLDPTGYRWLNETYLSVDRGVEFYNTAAVELDGLMWANRIGVSAIGLLGSIWAARHLGKRLKGAHGAVGSGAAATPAVAPAPGRIDLGSLSMRSTRPGFLRGAMWVALAEVRELRSQPGLYLFIPLIILQVIGNAVTARGAFDAPLLLTSGTFSLRMMGLLTTLVALMLMFYQVESLRREAGTRLAGIAHATPLRTPSLLLGKALANSMVGLATLLVTFATACVVMTVVSPAPIELDPFALIWGLLLLPTFLLWCAFLSAVYSIFKNRYTTYAVALAALTFTGFQALNGGLDWTTNWPLWSTLTWTDMGVFELVREELLLNRVLALCAAGFFVALTVRFYPRRERDDARTAMRLRPKPLLIQALILLVLALPALSVGFVLDQRVDAGFQGEGAEDEQKDYWRKNVRTWLDASRPDIEEVDFELDLFPAESRFHVRGSYELVNRTGTPMHRLALTGNPRWDEPSWTLNDEEFEPRDDSGLMVFELDPPLAVEDRVQIGFEHGGHHPDGATSNGGGASTFILPSGVVLTSFEPTWMPMVGFVDGIGVDEKNSSDARQYEPGFQEGRTRSLFGTGAPARVRSRISAPEDFTINGVGSLVSEEVVDRRRIVEWDTGYPVDFFNVVAARWEVKRGEGTSIYYHPEHHYNIEAMSEALDGSRRFYSEWFHPFPWDELKLSEFPAHAGYAQGFPTNITFSESIGFLTKDDDESSLSFFVTAHEAAHQWWGNLVVPGEGPGGNVLSEGMANYSTVLLHEEMRGLEARILFCERMEDNYGNGRQADSEQPLVWIDGSRAGDGTVLYDRGGWAFWMLHNTMGRKACLEGLQAFMRHYHQNPDHPVLFDFVDFMRPYAPDEAAYDAFIAQWFLDKVVPEYRFTDVELNEVDGQWEVSFTLTNHGTGVTAVAIAASRGERFPESEPEPAAADADASPAEDVVSAAEPAESEPYLEVRGTLAPGPGESQTLTLRCDFEPERLVVDPDALVLQLNRKQAREEL